VKIAPETFDLDADGLAIVAGEFGERAIEAAECCPFSAITVYEEATGAQAA
jgi:ferredoxin